MTMRFYFYLSPKVYRGKIVCHMTECNVYRTVKGCFKHVEMGGKK